jgi:DNA-binding transcriptional LysR family regulator
MDTRQLRHFVALAETLNYHRAAERLHISQPPLSASIRKLEEELGVRLFERTRRGTHLTPAGEAALADARRALFHTEQFGRTAAATARGEAGTLRIGFIGSATYSLMPRLMPLFRARYPDVELVLSESTTQRLIEQVEQGDLDAGLLRFPMVQATQARMTPIERDVFVAALPEGHPLLAKPKLKLSDLASEAFVMYSAQAVPGLHAMALLACQQAGFVPQVQQEAVQVQTVVSLVESGLGVALVPSVATRHAMPGVVFRKVHGPGAATEIGIALLWRPDTETPAARRFRETLVSLENPDIQCATA